MGTGGTAGSDPAGSGGTGGDSWFGTSSTVLAKGGPGATGTAGATAVGGHIGSAATFNGGNGGAGATHVSQARGGAGGGASGGSAANGTNGSGNSAGTGGSGGTAVTGGGPGGDGGTAPNGNGSIPASGPGGGGGGGSNDQAGTGTAGGAGFNGRVLVTWEDVPTISDVETDEEFTDADTDVTITGTNFLASQGSGTVELASTSDYATATKVSQTVTSWGTTSIDFTASLGGLTAGALFLFVTNSGVSRSTGFAVTVTANTILPVAAAQGITVAEAASVVFQGASWREALNTPITVNITGGNVQLRLRIGLLNDGTATGATAFKWQYRKNVGTWTDLTASSTNVKTFGSSHFADGDDVPQLITSSTYQTDNNAAVESTGAFTLTAGLAASTRLESEIALELVAADLVDQDSLEFRLLLADDTPLDTYTVTPSITIEAVAGDLSLTPSQAITVAESAAPLLPLAGISVGDTLAVAETVTVSGVSSLTLTEIITVAEAPSLINALLPLFASDILTLTDTPTVVNALLPLSAAQETTVAESPTATLTVVGATALTAEQAITVSEAITIESALPGLAAEELLTVTEAASVVNAILPVASDQALTVTETATLVNARLPVIAAEEATIVETASVFNASLPASASDTITVVDIATLVNAQLPLAAVQAITVSEAAPLVDAMLPVTAAQAVTITETPNLVNALVVLTATQALTITESPTLLIPVIGVLPVIASQAITVSLSTPQIAGIPVIVPPTLEWRVARATLSSLSGATATATNLIPASCVVWGVETVVDDELTDITGFDVGDETHTARWGENLSPALAASSGLADMTITAPPYYGPATDIILTSIGGPFTGGEVTITVFYATLTQGLHDTPWLTATTTLSGLSGPTATATNLIPANCYVIGVQAEVVTTITGATGFDCGDGLSPDEHQNRWGDNLATADGTLSDIEDFTLTSVPRCGAAHDVVLVARGSNFTGGAVALTVYYANLTQTWGTAEVASLALSGASITIELVSEAAWLIGVELEVLTEVTGATGINIGDGTDPTRWGSAISPTLGTVSTIGDFAPTSLPSTGAPLSVTLTGVGGSFTGGTVRLTAYYATLSEASLNTLMCTLSETLTISENPTVVNAILPVAAVQTMALTDVATVTNTLLPLTATQALTITEVASLINAQLPITATQALTLTDTATLSNVLLPLNTAQLATITEAATIAPFQVLAVATQALTIAEQSSVTNALLPVLGSQAVTLTETGTLTNPILPLLADQPITVAESLTVVRTLVGILSLVAEQAIALTETAVLTEAIPGLVLSQDVTVADTSLVSISRNIILTQLVTVGETPTVRNALLPLTATQPITVVESPTVVVTAVAPRTIAVAEAITLTDSASVRNTLLALTSSQQVTLSESAQAIRSVDIVVPPLAPPITVSLATTPELLADVSSTDLLAVSISTTEGMAATIATTATLVATIATTNVIATIATTPLLVASIASTPLLEAEVYTGEAA